MQIQRGAYSTLWLCIGLTFPYSQPWSRSLRVWLLGYGAFSRNSAEGSPWDWIWDLSIPFTSFIILNYSQIFCWYIQEMLDLVLLFYSVKKVGVPGWWRWEFQQVCVCVCFWKSGLLKVEKGSGLGRSPAGLIPAIRLSFFTKSAILLLISDQKWHATPFNTPL